MPITPEKIHRYPTRHQSYNAADLNALLHQPTNNPIGKVPFTLENDALHIIDEDTCKELEYRHLIKREKYKDAS